MLTDGRTDGRLTKPGDNSSAELKLKAELNINIHRRKYQFSIASSPSSIPHTKWLVSLAGTCNFTKEQCLLISRSVRDRLCVKGLWKQLSDIFTVILINYWIAWKTRTIGGYSFYWNQVWWLSTSRICSQWLAIYVNKQLMILWNKIILKGLI